MKLPPHLSTQVVYTIRPGDEVSIRGIRARAIPLVDAASVTNVATGRSGPKEAEQAARLLLPHAKIAVRGDGIETKHGRMVHAKEIGTGSDDLRPIKEAKAKPKPKPKHDQAAHT